MYTALGCFPRTYAKRIVIVFDFDNLLRLSKLVHTSLTDASKSIFISLILLDENLMRD